MSSAFFTSGTDILNNGGFPYFNSNGYIKRDLTALAVEADDFVELKKGGEVNCCCVVKKTACLAIPADICVDGVQSCVLINLVDVASGEEFVIDAGTIVENIIVNKCSDCPLDCGLTFLLGTQVVRGSNSTDPCCQKTAQRFITESNPLTGEILNNACMIRIDPSANNLGQVSCECSQCGGGNCCSQNPGCTTIPPTVTTPGPCDQPNLAITLPELIDANFTFTLLDGDLNPDHLRFTVEYWAPVCQKRGIPVAPICNNRKRATCKC